MADSRYAVRVSGVNELVRAFGKIDKSLRLEITSELRNLAREIKGEVTAKASEQGFDAPGKSGRGTGELIRNIKYGVSGGSAYIRETANKNGYNYPAVYEYGHNSPWQHKYGIRPFINPVIDKNEAHITSALEGVLDRLLGEEA